MPYVTLKGCFMFQRNKLAGVVAGVVLAVGATAASATTIDFTNASTGTSGTAGNVGWTLTAGTTVGLAGTANNSQLFDGQALPGPAHTRVPHVVWVQFEAHDGLVALPVR